jgi:ribosome-associated translation inhibitor RaiA
MAFPEYKEMKQRIEALALYQDALNKRVLRLEETIEDIYRAMDVRHERLGREIKQLQERCLVLEYCRE